MHNRDEYIAVIRQAGGVDPQTSELIFDAIARLALDDCGESYEFGFDDAQQDRVPPR